MIRVFYDGECPFCSRYVQMMRLQRSDEVQLIDLRQHDALREELLADGFNLDGGMVVEDRGIRHADDKAVAYIASLTTQSDAFNRLNRWLFSIPAVAWALYPLLRSGRWLVLFLMGRSFITSTGPQGSARQEIFATVFAMFSVFHFFNYAFEYQRFPPS